jgi:hypothetical protein
MLELIYLRVVGRGGICRRGDLAVVFAAALRESLSAVRFGGGVLCTGLIEGSSGESLLPFLSSAAAEQSA